MIAVLGNQDVGEQGRAGETLGDRTFRSRRLVDGPAGPATVTRAANPDNPEPRRHMIKHLADGLADHMQRAAAAGAGLVLDIEPSVVTGQVYRQTCSIDLRLGPGCFARR